MREISLNDYEYDDYEYSVIGSVINGWFWLNPSENRFNVELPGLAPPR